MSEFFGDYMSRERAETNLPSTASASQVPSASPFSKSSLVCPIVLVTSARQSTAASLAALAEGCDSQFFIFARIAGEMVLIQDPKAGRP